MARPTRALISSAALIHNYSLAQKGSGAHCMPMVKANAYGHGAKDVCKILDQAPAFGVASIEEALELRESGIQQPILLLEGTFSACEIAIAETHNFWVMIENHRQLDDFIAAPVSSMRIWLGVDTGMHRLGFKPQEVNSVYQRLARSGKVDNTCVLASHFASADQRGDTMNQRQLTCFEQAYRSIAVSKGTKLQQSLANSAALLTLPATLRDWQRPGYMLYGNPPFIAEDQDARLKPVMNFVSAVSSLRRIDAGQPVGYAAQWTTQRTSVIATVPVGYADGYPRHAPNNTPVLVNTQRAPLVGRVSMDMITVDVTDLPSVQIGDPVTLWGSALPVNEIARRCQTNGYELLSGVSARVPRVIHADEDNTTH